MTISGAGPQARSTAASTADALAPVRDRVEAMAGLGIWRLDLRTRQVAWSPEMYRIVGLDPRSGRDMDEGAMQAAVHPADRRRYADAIAGSLGGILATAECRIRRQDGGTAWIRVGAAPELDATGHPIAMVGYWQSLAQLDVALAAMGVATAPGKAPGSAPLAAPVPARPMPVRRVPPEPAGVVLLVEDEDIVRHVLGRMLGSLGFSVLEASTGDEALELIGHDQEDGIDLVVTDIRMPGVSGPELARRVRTVRDVPVLFVSGYVGDLADEVRHARRTHVLEKPFDAESLRDAIRTVLALA